MNVIADSAKYARLTDPTGRRNSKPRSIGQTMVIDKGLGLYALEDLLETAGAYIDILKIGFGTAPLYPQRMLHTKIKLAKAYDIRVIPGGTFLEVALQQNEVDAYFRMIEDFGFDGIEVSDGTIEIDRTTRNRLIARGVRSGLTVFTEYGKKCWGSTIDIEAFIETIRNDIEYGATLVTVEGRESGRGVGIYDDQGECRDGELRTLLQRIPCPDMLLWEAPLKSQQVHLLQTLGADVNLGNIAPSEVLSLEALRRGLRSDTFSLASP